jgi:hypothetical protein
MNDCNSAESEIVLSFMRLASSEISFLMEFHKIFDELENEGCKGKIMKIEIPVKKNFKLIVKLKKLEKHVELDEGIFEIPM